MKSAVVSKHILFISACSLSSFAMANNISGIVKTENGELLNDGVVQVMGTNKRVPIQSDGRFSIEGLDTGEVELHVSAPSYVHSTTKLTLTTAGISDVEIEVSNASIEILDVTASAFHASSIESAAPVNVLAGDELKSKQSATLGETLKNEVGVHSTFYAGVTSSPIIRGLDGPRVLITQNGMDAGDASRVGPDHLVSTEASTATQIEVLRGPATLFYGSGAIGGVVNIVDERIPSDNQTEGEVSVSRNTNNSEEAFAGEYKSAVGDFAFNLQGFYRDSDSYRIPGYAESEEAHDDDHDDHDEDHDDEHGDEEHEGSKGIVENTQSRTQGFTFGGSYLLENGFIGASVEHQSSLYGIPGHAHGHEDEHEDEHDDEHGEEEVILGDMQQNRYQIASRLYLEDSIFTEFNGTLSFTNYTHAEIEDGEEGTRFSNDSLEGRFELLHQPIMGWRGGLSLHYKDSDFEAIGEEAFTPPSNTQSIGLGLIEEQHFGDWLIQLGARVERVEIDVPALQFADIELHSEHEEEHDEHDEEHHEEEHHDEHGDLSDLSGFSTASYTPFSLSAGAVWDFKPGYNFGVSYVAAERAPSTAELYAFGPHIGTSTYELGALFKVEEDGEIEINPAGLRKEKSQNIDISLRKFKGDFGFVINAFFNSVDDYYYAADTGFLLGEEHGHDEHDEDMHDDEAHHDDEHGDEEHGEEGHDEHGHEDELPVFAYVSEDVELYGLEAEFNWRVSNNIALKAQGDIVKTKIVSRGNENLPRTPPARFGLAVDYTETAWNASLQAMRYFDQNDVASFETATDGYTIVDFDFNYYMPMGSSELTFFAKARNLTDQEARVHTSFLKDLAPLPGRSFVLGVRANF
jgi:iron complex outermembrane receptor protein